jgi:hypothetical protein
LALIPRAGTFLLVLLSLFSQTLVRSQAPTAEALGVRVTIPAGWVVNREIVDLGGPLSMTSAPDVFDRGGIIAPGAAEVDIVQEPVPAEPLGEYIKRELDDAAISSTSEGRIGGTSAIRVEYTDTYGDLLSQSNVTYYLVNGGKFYKFYLTARTGEPEWKQWVAAFDSLAVSAVFVQ